MRFHDSDKDTILTPWLALVIGGWVLFAFLAVLMNN